MDTAYGVVCCLPDFVGWFGEGQDVVLGVVCHGCGELCGIR